MPHFDVREKRPHINIFKIDGAYYFKYFFDDPELFMQLEPFYGKQWYRFKIPTTEERNKVVKLLERKEYDPLLIEDPTHYTINETK